MGDRLRIRVPAQQPFQLVQTDVHVCLRRPVPEQQPTPGHTLYIGTQMLVRREDDGAIVRYAVHYAHRVAAGADDVAHRLHRRTAVDAADHHMAGMVVEIPRKPCRCTRPANSRPPDRAPAPCGPGSAPWRSLGHEVHTGEQDTSAVLRSAIWAKGKTYRPQSRPIPGCPASGNCANNTACARFRRWMSATSASVFFAGLLMRYMHGPILRTILSTFSADA